MATTNLQKFDLEQNGRHYILTTEIEGEYVKLTCVETGVTNPPVFIGKYSLIQLKALSTMFNTISTILQAQELLDQTIENQKVSVEHNGNIINITLYLSRESESEDSVIVKKRINDQDKLYNKPIQYNYDQNQGGYTETTTTTITETITNTNYNQGQTLPPTQVIVPTVETTTTKEVYSTGNGGYDTQNYTNYDNLQNYDYQNYNDLNTAATTTTTTTTDYNTTYNTNEEPITLYLNPAEVQQDYTYQTDAQNQDYNQYQTTTTTTTETQYQQYPTTYTEPVIPETQITYPIESPQREQIQYTYEKTETQPEVTYTTVPSYHNPDNVQQEKTVKTTTTTTRQYNPPPVQQMPSVDVSIYNERINQLQSETDRMRGENDNLRNEVSRLNGELGALRSQLQIITEENRILKEKKGTMPNENQFREIANLKQENESLKRKLQDVMIEKSTFEQYKRLKEEENNFLKLQIDRLLQSQKKLEEILLLKQKEIDELKYQLQQLMKNVNVSETKNYILRQQQKVGTGKLSNQTLTIQDARMEIVKGDIIRSTAELELLTRKICQQYKKITLNLLYKATIDSDKAAVFHNKCDWANRTLVLVRSGNGKRFGGYTSCSWKGDSIEKKDESAFVFSLDKMQIYDIIPGEDAIGCYPKYGPVFLGCQIRIFDEFFTKGGTTFEKGLNYNTLEDYELTGGFKKFEVKEIEVYGVVLE